MLRRWWVASVYLAVVLWMVRTIDRHHQRWLLSAAVHVKKKAPLPLRFGGDGSFKILQVADVHYGSGPTTRCRDVHPGARAGCSDLNSTRFLRRLIEAERPDLIAFTGDNVFGSSALDAAESMAAVFAPAVEAGIPWAAVLGNHDHEGASMGRQEMMLWASLMDYSVARVYPRGYARGVEGFGNYAVEVRAWDNSTSLELIFLDSGHRESVDGLRTYGWIRESQLRWLKEKNNGNSDPVETQRLAFFHIPIPEMRRQLHPGNVAGGSFQEGVASSSVDSGVLPALFSLGGFRAAFLGHDHINDFCGPLQGIWFCYGGGFGYHAYGRPGWARRARLIEARLDPSRTRLHTIRTWKRLDDPLLTLIDPLLLWQART